MYVGCVLCESLWRPLKAESVKVQWLMHLALADCVLQVAGCLLVVVSLLHAGLWVGFKVRLTVLL